MLEFEEVHFITPDKMYVEDGNTGLVKCGAQGSPKPDVSWISLDSQQYTSSSTEGTKGTIRTKPLSSSSFYQLQY